MLPLINIINESTNNIDLFAKQQPQETDELYRLIDSARKLRRLLKTADDNIQNAVLKLSNEPAVTLDSTKGDGIADVVELTQYYTDTSHACEFLGNIFRLTDKSRLTAILPALYLLNSRILKQIDIENKLNSVTKKIQHMNVLNTTPKAEIEPADKNERNQELTKQSDLYIGDAENKVVHILELVDDNIFSAPPDTTNNFVGSPKYFSWNKLFYNTSSYVNRLLKKHGLKEMTIVWGNQVTGCGVFVNESKTTALYIKYMNSYKDSVFIVNGEVLEYNDLGTVKGASVYLAAIEDMIMEAADKGNV